MIIFKECVECGRPEAGFDWDGEYYCPKCVLPALELYLEKAFIEHAKRWRKERGGHLD